MYMSLRIIHDAAIFKNSRNVALQGTFDMNACVKTTGAERCGTQRGEPVRETAVEFSLFIHSLFLTEPRTIIGNVNER